MAHSWWALTLGFAGSLALWWYAVSRWESPLALCSLAVSAAVGAYVLADLRRHAQLNRPTHDASLYPTLGIANALTVGRGLLLALLAGFICVGQPPAGWQWLPGLLYAAAIVADFADGLAARLTGHVSLLGEYMDMNLDGLGVLVASLLVVRLGRVPWWYALAGLARYLHRGRPLVTVTGGSYAKGV